MGQSNQIDYLLADPSSIVEDWGNYSPASPNFPTNPYLYDLLVDQPPPSVLPSGASSALPSEAGSVLPSEASSALPSEVNSPWVSGDNSPLSSDSDLPPTSFTKATKQTNLFGFFSKVPSEDLHEKWQKRKRDNEAKDREEHMEQKQKDEAYKLRKLSRKRARNSISQRKRRARIREEEATLSEEGKDSQVSSVIYTLYFSTYS